MQSIVTETGHVTETGGNCFHVIIAHATQLQADTSALRTCKSRGVVGVGVGMERGVQKIARMGVGLFFLDKDLVYTIQPLFPQNQGMHYFCRSGGWNVIIAERFLKKCLIHQYIYIAFLKSICINYS